MQIAFLGLVYTAIGVLTDSSYALAAGTAGKWLKRSPVYLG
jgi:threonine/homoserine/homoserine lactone efflux protein